ncbi:outer membrane protein, putative [Citrifermentans bemidjiense Bem]|uniref:Outer membrane protein, putative n=1 Tax=Citrifermentans bemidjiense (strain ATCC BAA-1014 / DSM 16622 / JCM 12645 / Bem) TaxID=404380 RepID=B5EEU3_CITBB|nr:DUF4142 domain-containing protein [Citrifermentans bemidjiense]ACH37839.1 outer membrane protein, putative [Citrifermentans bemidjiense Bem]
MKKFLWMAVVSLFALSMAIPALAAEKMSRHDKAFVKEAASGGMMEVEAGRLAQQKGASQEIKDFGQMMVTDHGKANDELDSIISKKQLKKPAKMEAKHKKMVDQLNALSGAEFDKKYAKEMVKDHEKDVATFKKASTKVKDPELKGWVDKTLPVLEQHLQHAKDMAKKLGVEK